MEPPAVNATHAMPGSANALVELQEGPRLITNIVNAEEALIGDALVELAIEREGEFALGRFRLVRSPH